MNEKHLSALRPLASSLQFVAASALVAGMLGEGIAAQSITEVAKLTTLDGAGYGFGHAVSISGDHAIVGSRFDDDLGSSSGSAYIFELGPTGWVEQAKLTASDGSAGDKFGEAVSISGNRAIVGASANADFGFFSGSAYVFELGPTGWVEQAKLLASDGAGWDTFGSSVSIDGDYAIVGSPSDSDLGSSSGSAYIFEYGPTGWVQRAKLLASAGTDYAFFGRSVSILGDRAIVGSDQDENLGIYPGAVYVFERGPGGWVEQARLTAADLADGDAFGRSVSLSANRAIIGAYTSDDLGSSTGSAYVFEHGPGGWAQQAKLTASDPATDDRFGTAVSISGDRAVIGAPLDDDLGLNSGSVYVFAFGPDGWVEQAKLTASDGSFEDYFGQAVSISGNRAIIGGLQSHAVLSSAYLHDFGVAPASSAVRNGILGLNPPDLVGTSEPRLGLVWSSQIATAPTVGQSTTLTLLTIGLGGPVEGVQVFGFELLALPPFGPLQLTLTGSHAFRLPKDASLAAVPFTAQGMRLEMTGGTNHLVLTNALDLVLGY